MAKKEEITLVTIPQITEESGKDPSQVNKDIKRAGITIQKVVNGETKKVCNAISASDYIVLQAKEPSYLHKILKELPKGAKGLEDFAKEVNKDPSHIRKLTKKLGMLINKAKVSGRAVSFLTKEQMDEIRSKIVTTIVV